MVPGLAARLRLLFDDTAADLRHEVEWEAVVAPLGADVKTAVVARLKEKGPERFGFLDD